MTVTDIKHWVRARSEYGLRLAAMEDVARRYPGRTSKSALPPVGAFWRYVFVPLFRRVPWSFKRKAMRALKMTARNWPEDPRRFGEPWRPPAGGDHLASAGQQPAMTAGQRPPAGEGIELPQEGHGAER